MSATGRSASVSASALPRMPSVTRRLPEPATLRISNTGTVGARKPALLRIGRSGTCETLNGMTVGEWLCNTALTSARAL